MIQVISQGKINYAWDTSCVWGISAVTRVMLEGKKIELKAQIMSSMPQIILQCLK